MCIRDSHGDAPRLLLTCGKQDVRLDDCRHYHEVLGMLGIAHTYIEQDGMHDWYYFDAALQHALQWPVSYTHLLS